MARQCGPNYIIGTIGNTTYYKMNGIYYARAKSSLERKRVKTDRQFSNTMRNANWFGQASKISSAVFRFLLASGSVNRKDRIDRKIQKRSVELLRTGMENEEIKRVLIKEFEHYALSKIQKTVMKSEDSPVNQFAEKVMENALVVTAINHPDDLDKSDAYQFLFKNGRDEIRAALIIPLPDLPSSQLSNYYVSEKTPGLVPMGKHLILTEHFKRKIIESRIEKYNQRPLPDIIDFAQGNDLLQV